MNLQLGGGSDGRPNAQTKSYLIEYEDGRPSEIIRDLAHWCKNAKISNSILRHESSKDQFYKGAKVKRKTGELLIVKRSNIRIPSPPERRCTVDGIKIYPTRGALAAELGLGKHGTRSPTFRFIDTDPKPKKAFYINPDTQEKKLLLLHERPAGWFTAHELREQKKDKSGAAFGRKWWNDGTQDYLLFPEEATARNLKLGRLNAFGKLNNLVGWVRAGRKWWNDGMHTYLLFPEEAAARNLKLGRLIHTE